MITYRSEAERQALVQAISEGYLEIFPAPSVERRLESLAPNDCVAVTCSPVKGVSATLDLTEKLCHRGFRVVPHVAAKMVRDRQHLAEIMARLADLPVDSLFVPGGDADKPLGDFETAFDLLQALADFDHGFTEIGVAAHPEGHPEVSDKRLLIELEKKQPLATYLVTQMCFDTRAISNWLHTIRERGIHLPVWLGIPGEAKRSALIRTSLRIGVGDSLRFLKRKSDAAMKFMGSSTYSPDGLMTELAPLLTDPLNRIVGLHVFCFNLVSETEAWRARALEHLEKEVGES